MMNNTHTEWQNAWPRAAQLIDDARLGAPDARAEQAFRLLAAALSEDSVRWPSPDPLALARDCLLVGAPLEEVRRGFVKIVYFSTKGAQLDQMLLALVFLVILARLHEYEGPVAWLSFPTSLLDAAQREHLLALMATITRIQSPWAAPVDLAFEPTDGSPPADPASSPPTIYIGSAYPFRRDLHDQSLSAFEASRGLPMTCIPSRATQGAVLRLGPTPLDDAGNA